MVEKEAGAGHMEAPEVVVEVPNQVATEEATEVATEVVKVMGMGMMAVR